METKSKKNGKSRNQGIYNAKSSRKGHRHKSAYKEITAPQSYYGTDEEDYTYRSLRTYSTTSFPLFSISDDEIIKGTTRLSQKGTKSKKTKVKICDVLKEVDTCSVPSISPLVSISSKIIPKPNDGAGIQSTSISKFPFQNLPIELKLKVFTYLSQNDKGRLMRTCRYWRELLRTPMLWTDVSLYNFSVHCLSSASHAITRAARLEGEDNCYTCYKEKVHLFCSLILTINPPIKTLDIKFDIGNPYDKYNALLKHLITHSNMSELKVLNFNWKDTPARPFWMEKTEHSLSCNDFMSSHRHRSRLFVYLFDDWTKISSKITTMVLPFDWSTRSMDSLLRLRQLDTLVLEKYFVFQFLEQGMLDRLLQGLPQLKRLMLEIWSPSGPGIVPFSFTSPNLEILDISQSRGLYISSLDMPNLVRFRIARHPWNGPLVCSERIYIPCLYEVISQGAPKLQKLNDHYLEAGWNAAVYPKLEEVLKAVCSCRKHKTGWAM